MIVGAAMGMATSLLFSQQIVDGVAVSSDDMLDVARGRIIGQYPLNKFGRNADIDGSEEDIWTGGGTWAAPTAARVHALVSTSDDDSDTGGMVAQGNGCRQVVVYGLTDWDTVESTETVVMDGTTAVNTSASYVIIHRMECTGFGSSGPNVGTITATAATDGTVTARIEVGDGQTLMAVYGVPSTQTLYIDRMFANLNKGTGTATLDAVLEYATDPENNPSVFVNKHQFGLISSGTSAFSVLFALPKPAPGPTIVKIAASVDALNTFVAGGFDGVLVDN